MLSGFLAFRSRTFGIFLTSPPSKAKSMEITGKKQKKGERESLLVRSVQRSSLMFQQVCGSSTQVSASTKNTISEKITRYFLGFSEVFQTRLRFWESKPQMRKMTSRHIFSISTSAGQMMSAAQSMMSLCGPNSPLPSVSRTTLYIKYEAKRFAIHSKYTNADNSINLTVTKAIYIDFIHYIVPSMYYIIVLNNTAHSLPEVGRCIL